MSKPIYKTLLREMTDERRKMLNMRECDLEILKEMDGSVLSLIMLDHDARVSVRRLFEETTDLDNIGKNSDYVTKAFYDFKRHHLNPVLEDLNEIIDEKTLIKKARGKGRAAYDATVSLDVAIHLLMSSKGEKGKRIRKYYIAAERLLRRFVELGWIYNKQLDNDRHMKSHSYHNGFGIQQAIDINTVTKAVIASRSACDYETLVDYEDCHRKAAKLIQQGKSIQQAIDHLSILY